jgi:hypothetical protein
VHIISPAAVVAQAVVTARTGRSVLRFGFSGHLAKRVLVFDDQHNPWTNVFASVCIYSSHDVKRIGLMH